jgi:hypothetical protein
MDDYKGYKWIELGAMMVEGCCIESEYVLNGGIE